MCEADRDRPSDFAEDGCVAEERGIELAPDASGSSQSDVTSQLLTASEAECSVTNSAPVAIPDLGRAESPITISRCIGIGIGSRTSRVAVDISHTYSGDLVVSLIAPDGETFVLQSRTGGPTANVVKTFTVDLSRKSANGTWKLRVQDAAAGDIGVVNRWTLELGGAVQVCTGTNSTPMPIADRGTVNSPVTLSGCAGSGSATSTVAVNISHTYSGDLVVSLIAPDGGALVLQSRVGGPAANLVKTFTVDLSRKSVGGTWTLRVQDAAAGDTGTLNTWTLTL